MKTAATVWVSLGGWITAVGFAWALGEAALAQAQTPVAAPPEEEPQPRPELPPEVALPAEEGGQDAQREVDAWAEEARVAYDAGRYADAIAAYLKVHQAVPTAATLYNVAYIYDTKLAELELARTFYRKYISAPDAEPAAVARATVRIREIGVELAAAPAPAAPAPAPLPLAVMNADTLDRGMSSLTLAGWITAGLGAALLAGGGTLGLLAAKTESDYANSRDLGEKRDLRDRGKQQALAADVMMGVGAAGLVAGVVLLVWPESDSEVSFLPTPAGAALMARF